MAQIIIGPFSVDKSGREKKTILPSGCGISEIKTFTLHRLIIPWPLYKRFCTGLIISLVRVQT
jgi:hypothetical protein